MSTPVWTAIVVDRRWTYARHGPIGMNRDREVALVFELVKELSELPGPTGHEDAVQDWIERRWSELAQDVRRTRVNNILARVGGTGPRLLLVAHADEICLMVKSVSDEGFLHLWPYYGDQLGKPPRWFTPLNQPAQIGRAHV